jgi:hypothetical protein
MKLFHTTSAERMLEIERDGFGNEDVNEGLSGVHFHLMPLGEQDGYPPNFNSIYILELPDEIAKKYGSTIFDDKHKRWVDMGDYLVPIAEISRFPLSLLDRETAEFQAEQAEAVRAAELYLRSRRT